MVFRGHLNGDPVAVKLPKSRDYPIEVRDQVHLIAIRLGLISPQSVLKETSLAYFFGYHPHILTCIGAHNELFPGDICIVTPWMPFGDISQYVSRFGEDQIPRLVCFYF